MTYGHAERTLATIRLLEAETRELLCGLGHLDPEHAQWLRDAAESASRRLHSANAAADEFSDTGQSYLSARPYST